MQASTASTGCEMESGGEPGRINISERAHFRVRDFFECEHRGQIPTKERRPADMYFVNRVQPKLMGDLSANPPPQFVRRYRTCFERDPPSFPQFLTEVAK